MDNIELTLDDLHKMTTDELALEAAADDRVRTGTYLSRMTAFKAIHTAPDDEYNPDRNLIIVNIELMTDDGAYVGRVTTRISPDPVKVTTRNGGQMLDSLARRFKAFGDAVAGGTRNVGEIFEQAQETLFRTSVVEQFAVPADLLHPTHTGGWANDRGETWVTIEADDLDYYKFYTEQGLDPKVTVRRFYRIR